MKPGFAGGFALLLTLVRAVAPRGTGDRGLGAQEWEAPWAEVAAVNRPMPIRRVRRFAVRRRGGGGTPRGSRGRSRGRGRRSTQCGWRRMPAGGAAG